MRDTSDVCDVVRAAYAHSAPLRVTAGGSWLDAGRPVSRSDDLLLDQLRGIVEYNPGDLTLTARAGTTLAEIDDVTLPHGQWLPLDPDGDARATLGATLATASTGPLSATIGAPRDVALGLEVVTGEGIAVRAGGRVVKNVAGFDLVRLNVGAWGTLGVITEVTVRLRARPPGDVTVAIELPDGSGALAGLLRALRLAPLSAIAMELIDAPMARAVEAAHVAVALVRITGNEESVAAQRETLDSLGGVTPVRSRVWERLRCCDPAGASSVRLSRAPSVMADVWCVATEAAQRVTGAFVRATVERGVARIVAPAGEPEGFREMLATLSAAGTTIVERAPAGAWSEIPAPADRLSRGVRAAFDPRGILNPGILGASS